MNPCQNCQLNISSPPVAAVLAAIGRLETAGQVPLGTMLDVITETCTASGCVHAEG